MKNAWRLTSLMMAALMAAGTMAGCAKKPGSSHGGGSSSAAESGADPLAGLEGKLEGMLIVWVGETAEENFKKIAKSFEEATGMTVELVTYTGLSASDKLALDGPAGNGGDVYVQGGGGTMAKSVDQGLFMELPEAAFDIGAFTESAVDDYRYGGKLYGLPMGSETPALIYNKALIQTIPDTWEALMEECGKFADIPNDKYGLLMDPTNPYFTNALFVANGGYVFGEKDGVYDPADIGLNNQGVKDTYRMFKSYYEKGWWQRNAVFATMEKKFEEGKSPVIYDGPWSVANYQKAGIDVGVAPLPKLANGNTPLLVWRRRERIHQEPPCGGGIPEILRDGKRRHGLLPYHRPYSGADRLPGPAGNQGRPDQERLCRADEKQHSPAQYPRDGSDLGADAQRQLPDILPERGYRFHSV